MPGHAAPDRDPVVPVVLDDGGLAQPRRVASSLTGVRVGMVGIVDVTEHHHGEIEHHWQARLGACGPTRLARIG